MNRHLRMAGLVLVLGLFPGRWVWQQQGWAAEQAGKGLKQASTKLKQLFSPAAASKTIRPAPATAPAAPTATITVTSLADGFVAPANCPGANCRLRDAIAKAVSGDTINFAVAGTITLTGGGLDISKNLTITGPGAAQLTIHRSGNHDLFAISPATTAVINNLTLTNTGGAGGGSGIDNYGATTLSNITFTGSSGWSGTGIHNAPAATINITNATISQNFAWSDHDGGGGIYNEGVGIISNSTISNNRCIGKGGGILNTGDLTITNSTISDNASIGHEDGGGIYNEGTITITNTMISGNGFSSSGVFFGSGGGILVAGGTLNLSGSTVAANVARDGGGIFIAAGAMNITNSTISGNSSTNGGGIQQTVFVNQNPPTTTIINSTVSGNSVIRRPDDPFGCCTGFGGGIYIARGELTIANSTFSGNSAVTDAGGIYHSDGAVNLVNTTITGNSSPLSGGIRASSVTLRNTLIAGNVNSNGTGDIGINSGGAFTSLGNNLIGNRASTPFTPAPGDKIGTEAAPIDPVLAPLANYGGPTQTCATLPGSPAINAGNNCVLTNNCASNNLGFNLTTDQRGAGFNRQVGSAVDIGAFESRGFTMAISGGNNQSTPGATTFANPLAVTVTASAVGEPVNGGKVSFTPPATGASCVVAGSPGTITNGTANGTARANCISGVYQVAASATGAPTVNFSLTNTTSVTSSITTQPASQTVTAGFPVTFSVIAMGPDLSYQWRKGGVNIPGATSSSYSIASVTPGDAGNYDVAVNTWCGTLTSNAAALTVNCTVFVVSNASGNGSGTLPHAIANACPGATITIASSVGVISAPSGGFALNKNLTIQGPGAAQLTISGNSARRVFSIGSGVTVALTGMTIADGNANLAACCVDDSRGGGINNKGNLTITGCTLSGNQANGYGGAIDNQGTLTITGSTISDNSTLAGSNRRGGAIHSQGPLTITDSTITGNSATSGAGGGIYSGSNLTITNCTISGNNAQGGQGGALYNNRGTVTITGSKLYDNLSGQGAGVFNDGSLTLINSTISSNLASVAGGTSSGGGIHNHVFGALTIANGTLSGNSASQGAGIYNGGGTLNLANCTITRNTANSLGGVRSDGGGSVNLRNTIIAGNTNATGAEEISGQTFTSLGNNLIGNGSGWITPAAGDQIGTAAAPINPLLAPLADYGGPTQTHLLLPGSLAINAGNNCVLTNNCAGNNLGFNLTTDQRGSVFNRKVGSAVDIGALELQSNTFLTITPATLPNGTVDSAYNQTLSATGGSGNYSFSILNGSLPAGLALSATGQISGTPTAGGSFSFTVMATDNSLTDVYGTRTYTITITAVCTTPPSGLVDWWRAEGNAIDAVGGNHGVLNGSAAISTAAEGQVGQAFKFAGTNGYVALPDNLFPFPASGTGTTPFSFEIWFKSAAAGGVILGQQNVAPYNTVTGNVPAIYVGTDGKLRVEMFWNGAANPLVSAGTVNDNTVFHHLAVTYNGTQQIVYLDGQVMGSRAHTQTAYNASYKYQLGTGLASGWPGGSTANGGWFNFTGLIDEPSLYNRALTAQEVQTIFGAGTAGKCFSCPTINATVAGGGAICAGGSATVTVTLTGGVAPYTVTLTNGGGTKSGASPLSFSVSPAVATTYAVQSATDANGCAVAATGGATVTINPSTAITAQPQSATVCTGATASFSVAATGTGLSYQWRKNGVNISGATSSSYTTPVTVAGDNGALYSIVVTGTCGTVTSANATLTVSPTTAINAQPQSATVCLGATASFSVTAAGTGLSYQWRKNSVNISGATSSTYTTLATVAGDNGSLYSVVVSGSCGTPVTSANATLTINPATAITAQPQSATVCAGATASFSVTATGAGLTYQWRKNGTNISGATGSSYITPATVAGDNGAHYSVVVGGSCGTPVTSANATLTVNATTAITTHPVSLTRTVGQSASFSVTAAGANLSYQWRRNITNLPGAIASTYTINSVVPGDAAQYDVIVSGACGNVTSTAATLTVNCPGITVTPASLGSASTGAAFSQTFTQSGASGAITWNLTGTTPPGLTFNAGTATLSGTPTLGGSYSFTARATDANGCFGERQYTLGVDCASVTVSPASPNLPGGTAGTPYSQTFMAAGGASPHSFVISAGSLPAGLTLSTAGTLSSTPTAFGNFNFTVKATDANGCFGERAYTLRICGVISLTSSLPSGTTGINYNQTITASGGASPYSFLVTSGTLPAGLSLSDGSLSGTPTNSGSFSFTVTATDSLGCAGAQSYTVAINCSTVTINQSSLPSGTIGTTYNQSLTATGGSAPYAFSVSSGTLPSGLTLASGGGLTGTAATNGSFSFTVRATDANGCYGEQAFSVQISGGSGGLMFYPLPQPVRLLETRAGFSGCTAPGNPINANGTLTLPAQGACSGIPANAAAVTGNITVVPAGAGFLTLFPSSASQPTVANSNFGAGEVTNNVFTVGLGAGDGGFKIFSSVATHVIVDVTGYYAPPGAVNPGGLYFHPLTSPVRLLETRSGQNGCIAPGVPLTGTGNPNADPNLDLAVQGRSPVASPCNSIPASAQVLVGNATSVLPSGGGYLTIYPSGGARPNVASSNYAGNDVINGPFAVKLGADGKFKIYTFATTHLVIDILGYYSEEATDANGPGLLFNPLPSPVRLLETRPDFPGFPLSGCTRTNAKIPGNSATATHTQSAANFCGLPAAAQAVVGNVTVVNSAGAGFLTLFPGNLTSAPLVATSNYPAPATFGYNRHYFVALSPVDGTFKVLTQFTTDLILDASGYFAP